MCRPSGPSGCEPRRHLILTPRLNGCIHTCMTFAAADDLVEERCARMRAMCACYQLRRVARGVTQLYEAELAPA